MHITASRSPVRIGAICVAFAVLNAAATVVHAQPKADDKAAVKARAQKIRDDAAAEYKAARARCDARQGNDKDVCIKVAKAFLADARAGADAKAKAAR